MELNSTSLHELHFNFTSILLNIILNVIINKEEKN